MKALIDFGSKVNTMTRSFATKLRLKVQLIDIGAQKIDGSIFETFSIVLASFQVEDKLGMVRVFKKPS